MGAIDDAFRSRLHLTLYYPPLDASKSKKVWKVNIRRMKDSNAERRELGLPEIKIDKKKILQYAELNFEVLHWNGRQIRNAFQSALALAEFKLKDPKGSPVISVEQFKTIATASNEFDNYMKTTHGFDEDRLAQRERMRGEYKPAPEKRVQLKSLPNSEESESSDSEASQIMLSESDSDGSETPVKKSKRSKKSGKGKKTEKSRSRKTKKKSGDSADKKKTAKRKGKEKKEESEEASSDGDTEDGSDE